MQRPQSSHYAKLILLGNTQAPMVRSIAGLPALSCYAQVLDLLQPAIIPTGRALNPTLNGGI
jgi:hypothetical protein